mmetsp:Transcript_28002/g.32124  ORF Transcript_28002/g.32124 Transcript_28002/m.32124 type:complete len:212 (-) Transcript_28002:144-779(-)
MFDHFFRHVKEYFLHPFANFLGKLFTPNQITTISFFFGILTCRSVLQHDYQTALIHWTVNRVLDGMDGVVARLTNQQTEFGGFYDIVTDFIVYSIVPIALVKAEPSEDAWFALATMLASFFVNGSSLFLIAGMVEKRNLTSHKKDDDAKDTGRKELTSLHMPRGIVEGTETMFVYGFFIYCHDDLVTWFIGFSVAVWITAFLRFFWVWRHF